MNAKDLKKDLEKKLMRRGMLITIDGEVLDPPRRMFKTLGEEILWILNEAEIELTVNDLSSYLIRDKKIINKVMRKLTASNVNLVNKRKNGARCFYNANFNKDLDIKTAYKLVRMEATKYIR